MVYYMGSGLVPAAEMDFRVKSNIDITYPRIHLMLFSRFTDFRQDTRTSFDQSGSSQSKV